MMTSPVEAVVCWGKRSLNSVQRAMKRHILQAHDGFWKVRLSKVCAGVLGDGRAVLIELKVRT